MDACPSYCACERCEHRERTDLLALLRGEHTRTLRPVHITDEKPKLVFIDSLRAQGFTFHGIDPVDRPVFSHPLYGELAFQRNASVKTWQDALERRRESRKPVGVAA